MRERRGRDEEDERRWRAGHPLAVVFAPATLLALTRN